MESTEGPPAEPDRSTVAYLPREVPTLMPVPNAPLSPTLVPEARDPRATDALATIYRRASVRSYRYRTVEPDVLQALLEAAVRAPSAFDEEPWSFAVIEDRVLLRHISETAKRLWREESPRRPAHIAAGLPASDLESEGIWKDEFDLLYGAPTLVVIGSRSTGTFADAACWMATENLLLAADARGLGSCVVGSVLPALATTAIRGELGLPASFRAIAPVVLGYPKEPARPRPRRPPEILVWRK